MSEIRLARVSKTYGKFVAVRDVDLTIQDGEFLTLLGPSGCGKTTCLRMVAGFVQPTSGCIHFGERNVTNTPPHRRNTGMVFQHFALFPHLTVHDNVAFGLRVRLRKVPSQEVAERVDEALRLVHLEKLGDRYPSQLSGGQKQRVALARAVVIRPQILLLDEPLASLDLKLRQELQVELKRVQTTLRITTLFVTHDQGEALGLSDRIAVMRDGRILQIDKPTELYQRPINRYVAGFVGRTNFIPVIVIERHDQRCILALNNLNGHRVIVERAAMQFGVGANGVLAVRPEYMSLGTIHPNTLPATAEKITYLGDGWTITCKGPGGQLLLIDRKFGETIPNIGEAVTVCWKPSAGLLLPDE
jgi:spermidine/putrescine ABC transporter ATP-binding subunit